MEVFLMSLGIALFIVILYLYIAMSIHIARFGKEKGLNKWFTFWVAFFLSPVAAALYVMAAPKKE